MKKPISFWLLGLAVLSLLPLSVFSIWLILDNAVHDRATILARIQQTTRALIQSIDERFDSRIALLEGLATAASLREGRFERFHERALDALKSVSAGAQIIVSDRNGQQHLNTAVPHASPLPRRSEIEPVQQVFATGRSFVSNVFTEAVSQQLSVSVDIPVFADDGAVLYSLALTIPLSEFTEFLERQKLPPTWFAGLIDRRGVLAGRVPDPQLWVGKPAAQLLREGVLRSAEGSVETPTLENVVVHTTWSRSDRTGWAIAVALPSRELWAPVVFQARALVAAALIALAISALLAFVLGRQIATRLALLARRAEAMGATGAAVAPPRGIAEIDVVRQAMDTADDKIREQAGHLHLVIAELDHRVKNILANVQAIAVRTFGRTPETTAFAGRLHALAAAHAQLSRTQGRGSSLRQLLEAALGAHRDAAGRVVIEGPDVFLSAKATQGFSLALHELATNSVKYGSLSSVSGRVSVTWRIEGTPARLQLIWSEQGGPPVVKPARTGFGSYLIEKALAADLDAVASLHFPPQGVRFSVEVDLDRVSSKLGGSSLVTDGLTPVTSLRRGDRVLVVEDEALIGEQVSELLTRAGIAVELVRSVAKAEEVVSGKTFAAAILDVNVNGELVFPFARRLAEVCMPFLFLTGYETVEMWPPDLRHVLRLSKPVSSRELYLALGVSAPAEPATAGERSRVA